MDSSSNECLLFLSENLQDLRRLGTEWGFSEETIDRCAEKALKATIPGQPGDFSVEKLKEYYHRIKRKTGPKPLIAFGVVVFILIAYWGALTAIDSSEYLTEQFRDFEYQIGRYARFLSIPFHRIQKLEEFYSSECIIDNPLFKEPEPDCELCRVHKSVKELKTKVPTIKIHLLSYPLLHRGTQTPVRLEDVRKMVNTHKPSLQGQNIESTANWARFASDLARDDLEEQISKEEKFSCTWDSKDRMFLSQIMRKLFPRPSIIPKEMEVALQKYFLIDGKGSSRRSLPVNMMGGYTWYAQGTGTRTVVFTPHQQCTDICQSFEVSLKEGDIVTFPGDRWKVEVKEGGEDISVAFLGFMLP